MSEKVYVEGPNGLVIGHQADVAAGLLRHPDHKKAEAPKAGPTDEEVAAALEAARVADEEKAAAEAAALAAADEGKAPAGNASKDDWHAYALANGKTSADLDGLGQREIRALFTEA